MLPKVDVKELGGHAVQALEPGVLANVPGSHAVHALLL